MAGGLLIALSLAAAAAPAAGRIVDVKVHSPALEGNRLGDPADQDVAVYLPPSYDTASDRRYPVLYVLHGFADSYRPWAEGLARAIDMLVAAGTIGEMIVVVPNGRNAYLSCYFTDSAVTGNWETYLARDLVSFADRSFRTIAAPDARAIAGHSKGGFAAIRMGMQHPDVFHTVYAMSPCCLSLEAAVEAAPASVWEAAARLPHRAALDLVRRRVESDEGTQEDSYLLGAVALAAAFSPDPGRAPLLVDLPYVVRNGRVRPVAEVLALWRAASPVNRIALSKPALLQLRRLSIDYGLRDQFADIPRSARAFCSRLSEEGIPHTCEAYDGGHEDRLRERIPDVVLPHLSRALGAVAPINKSGSQSP